jgi:nucleoside-diphosphate-sugar epimerase
MIIKKALVTGAAGFVGSEVCRELISNGYQVTALVRETSDRSALAGLPVTFVIGDITDRASLYAAFPGHEYVFHIAALFRETTVSDQAFFDVNVSGTKNVLEVSRDVGVKRLIYCSTTGVTGDIKNPPGDESSPYAPRDVYQRSKTDAEKYLFAEMANPKTEIVIIRPIMIWGPGDTRLFKLFKGIKRGRMPIIGDGKTLFHFVLVSDLARGFRLAAEIEAAKGNLYLIGGKEIVPISRVFETIAQEVGGKVLPFRIPLLPVLLLAKLCELVCKPFGIAPPLYPRRVDFYAKTRAFCCKKASKELGFEAQNSFEQEVKITADWYRRHGWI